MISESLEVNQVFSTDAFREGKIRALEILYKDFLGAQKHGLKVIPTKDLLDIIRTLILNLERSDIH